MALIYARPIQLCSTKFRPPATSHGRIVASASNESPFNIAGTAQRRRQYSLPVTLEESVNQAKLACRYAIKDGLTRLQLEVLLPLIGATDLDDWPGGIQQQFKAAMPVVSSLLNGLIEGEAAADDSAYQKYFLDEGDATGVWEQAKIALVLFPTAESLPSIENLAKVNDRPLLLLNPQWQAGQVISDFGFGEQRKQREKFVQSFSNVYFLKQIRILGEDVRLLKSYPGIWQVFVIEKGGNIECIATEEEKPSYKRLQDILKERKGGVANKGWFGRLMDELKFNQDSLR
ncbi:hypothetical protein SUGI_1098740 [Cryptomeria japonica]|uniref:uncharacterized protein LOC131076863 n=1 Tax=Cryptomeria japonica TaxID=3369 RepID=UPI002414C705|nr:uncharacterized protein LOC131076863 [Cryptomeria japonica]GLJ51696.1 hypothetical protein SUGI_1098740 [Cryptomeria japonica]